MYRLSCGDGAATRAFLLVCTLFVSVPHRRFLSSHSGMHWSNNCTVDTSKDPMATPFVTLCTLQVGRWSVMN
jgi:hypothetical protein